MNGKPRDMDIGFAIKVLSTTKVDTAPTHGNPKRYGYQNQTFYDIARGMGIKALKKQMPKKAILDVIYPNGIEWYLCPACKHNNIEKTDAYCHACGQALDWSTKNEINTEKLLF